MTEADTENGAMRVDADMVRQLADLLDETNLTEIEVADGERRIRVARNTVTTAAPLTVATAAPPSAPASPPGAPAVHASHPASTPDHPGIIRSPMVGTAFLAPEPQAAQFHQIGDIVAEGATVLIVEAMKVMNPILAPRAGKIVAILVEDGQPVEFDQPLAIVE